MCLTVNERFKSKEAAIAAASNPLIAKEDIIVYKALGAFRNDEKTRARSPHRFFEFEKGYHYYQDDDTFGFRYNFDAWEAEWKIVIHEGLHACLKKSRAENHSKNVVRMTVPKGTKYFLNKLGDIVSTQLIWKS